VPVTVFVVRSSRFRYLHVLAAEFLVNCAVIVEVELVILLMIEVVMKVLYFVYGVCHC